MVDRRFPQLCQVAEHERININPEGTPQAWENVREKKSHEIHRIGKSLSSFTRASLFFATSGVAYLARHDFQFSLHELVLLLSPRDAHKHGPGKGSLA